MTVAKITVSLPENLAARARAAVERGDAASLSAYVAGALAARLDEHDLDQALAAALARTGGPITADEQQWLDELFGRDR
ncbi:MAG: hypothetical protein ACR2O6_13850 [Ilumatobacteraceae bacterium]